MFDNFDNMEHYLYFYVIKYYNMINNITLSDELVQDTSLSNVDSVNVSNEQTEQPDLVETELPETDEVRFERLKIDYERMREKSISLGLKFHETECVEHNLLFGTFTPVTTKCSILEGMLTTYGKKIEDHIQNLGALGIEALRVMCEHIVGFTSFDIADIMNQFALTDVNLHISFIDGNCIFSPKNDFITPAAKRSKEHGTRTLSDVSYKLNGTKLSGTSGASIAAELGYVNKSGASVNAWLEVAKILKPEDKLIRTTSDGRTALFNISETKKQSKQSWG